MDSTALTIVLGIIVFQILISSIYFWIRNKESSGVKTYCYHVLCLNVLYFLTYIWPPVPESFYIIYTLFFSLQYFFVVQSFFLLLNIRYPKWLNYYWLYSLIIIEFLLDALFSVRYQLFVAELIICIIPISYLIYALKWKMRSANQPSEISFLVYSLLITILGQSLYSVSQLIAFNQEVFIQIVESYSLVITVVGHMSATFALMMLVSGQNAIKLNVLANQDGLTKVLNRRAFSKKFKLQGNRGAIILFDVDHFKLVNDEYGHIAGDNALVHVAKVAQSMISKHDLIGRYGGEEFIIFLSNVDKAQCEMVSERIRKSIEVSTIEYQGMEIKLTVSLGIAEVENSNLTEIIELADQRLYKAKNSGRNQTCSA